jgi:hypothetical protein
MQPKARSTMKQKEIVLKASRFSVVTAFVLSSVLGLNSCRDEFNDEDQLKMELEALEAAKRRADSLRLVEMQAELQGTLDQIRLEDSIVRSRDSLAAIKGKFYYAVNVVYGNTAVFAGSDANGRTSDVEKLSGATVSVSQKGVKTTVTLGNDGLAVFPGWFVAGELTGTIVKAGFTPVQFKVVLDAPARVADGGATENEAGFTPPVYSASSIVPVFELPAGNATLDPLRFSQVGGNFTIESNLTNSSRESLDGAANGVIVTANIDGNGTFFNIFKTAQQAEVISGSGDLLQKGATSEIVELSYSSAVFAATVSGNSYTMVVPASPTNSGLPLKVKFADVALNQTHYDLVGTEVTTRAVFGAQNNEVIPAVSALNFADVELTQPETGGEGASVSYSVNAFIDADGTVIGFNLASAGLFNQALLGIESGEEYQLHELPSGLFNVDIDHFADGPEEDQDQGDDNADGVGEPNWDIDGLVLLEEEDITITFSEADADGNVSIASIGLTEGHTGGLGYVKAPEITITSSATPVVTTTTYFNYTQAEQIETQANIAQANDIKAVAIPADRTQLFSPTVIKLKVSGGALDKIFVVDGDGAEEQVSNSSVTIGDDFTQAPLWRFVIGGVAQPINTAVNGAELGVTLNEDGSVTVSLLSGGAGFTQDSGDNIDVELIDPITGATYKNLFNDDLFDDETEAKATMDLAGWKGHALGKVSRVTSATGYITEVAVDQSNYGKYAKAPKAIVVDGSGNEVTSDNRTDLTTASFELVMGAHPDDDGTFQVDRIIVTASGAGYKMGDQVVLVDDVTEEAEITASFEEIPTFTTGFYSAGTLGVSFDASYFTSDVLVSVQAISETNNTGADEYVAATAITNPTFSVSMSGGPLVEASVDLTVEGNGYSNAPLVTSINNGVNAAFTRYQDQGYTVAEETAFNSLYVNAGGTVNKTGGAGFTAVSLADIEAAYGAVTPTAAQLSLRKIPVFDFEMTSTGPVVAINPSFTDVVVAQGSANLPVRILQIDPVTNQPVVDGNGEPVQGIGELIPSSTTTGSNSILVQSQGTVGGRAGGSYFTVPQIYVGNPAVLTTLVPTMVRDQFGSAQIGFAAVGDEDFDGTSGPALGNEVFVRVPGPGIAPAIIRLTLDGDGNGAVNVTAANVVSSNRGQGFTKTWLLNNVATTASGYSETAGVTLLNFNTDPELGCTYHPTLADAINNSNGFTPDDEPIFSITTHVSQRIVSIPGTTTETVITTSQNGSLGGIPAEEQATLSTAGSVPYASYTPFAGDVRFSNVEYTVVAPSNWNDALSDGGATLTANEILFVHNFDRVNTEITLNAAPATGTADFVLAKQVTDVEIYNGLVGNNFTADPVITLETPDLLGSALDYDPFAVSMTADYVGLSFDGIIINDKGRYNSNVDGLRWTFTNPDDAADIDVVDQIFINSQYKLLNSVLNVVNNGEGYEPGTDVVATAIFPGAINTSYSALPFDILPTDGTTTGTTQSGLVEVSDSGEIPTVNVQTSLTLPPSFTITAAAPAVIAGVTNNMSTDKRKERLYLDGISFNVSNIYDDADLNTNVEVGNAVANVEIIYGGGLRDNFNFESKYTAAPMAIFPEKNDVRATGTATIDANGRVSGVTSFVVPTGYTPAVGDIVRFSTFGMGDFNWDGNNAEPIVDVSATAGFGSVVLGTDGIEGLNNDGAGAGNGFRSKVRFSTTPTVTVTAYEAGSDPLKVKGSGLQATAIMSAAGTGEVIGLNVTAGGQGYSSSDLLRIVLSAESSTTTTTGGVATMVEEAEITTTLDSDNGAIGDIANLTLKAKGENYLGDGRFRSNKDAGVVDIIFYAGDELSGTDEEKMAALKSWIRSWEASGKTVAYGAGTPEANEPEFTDETEGLSAVTLVEKGKGYASGVKAAILSRKQSILLEAALEGYTLVEEFSNSNDPDTENEFAWMDNTNEKTKAASFARAAEGVAVIGSGVDSGKIMGIGVEIQGQGYFFAPEVNISYRYRGPQFTSGVNGECTVDMSTDANNNGIIEESEYVTTKPECIVLGAGATATATIDENGSVTGFTVTSSGNEAYGNGADVQNWQAGSFESAKIGGTTAVRTGNAYNILTGVKIIRDIFYGTGWRGILKSE